MLLFFSLMLDGRNTMITYSLMKSRLNLTLNYSLWPRNGNKLKKTQTLWTNLNHLRVLQRWMWRGTDVNNTLKQNFIFNLLIHVVKYLVTCQSGLVLDLVYSNVLILTES